MMLYVIRLIIIECKRELSANIPRELKATGTGAFSGAGTGAVTDLVAGNRPASGILGSHFKAARNVNGE